jgi:TPR repeat protein
VAAGSVAGQPLRVPGSDHPALDAEIARLRATARTPAAAGAVQGQAQAAWVLGLLYLHGIGVAASPAEAATWFERAQMLGEPLAPAGLAWCEIEGCKNSPNPAAARRWIMQLREVDLPRAQYLQWVMETHLSPLQIAAPGLRGEPAATGLLPNRQLLLSAAESGDVHARIELGFESVADNRLADALEHFRAAAPRSAAASANAALLSERLRSMTDSRRLQAPRPPLSSDDAFARAQRNHRGEGQPANYVEAIRLYRLAQSQGNVQAKKMLELIFSRPAVNGEIDIAWMQQLAYIDLSKDAVMVDGATVRRVLRREPTPLVDLLPPFWRRYAGASPAGKR